MNKRDQEAVNALNQWGVPFLSNSIPCANPQPLDAGELILRLIQSDNPRLKLGVTAFFIIHAEKAAVVFESLSLLDKKSGLLLKYYYTAALFLQRLWKSQLAHFGSDFLPDYFSEELGLPKPDLLHGRLGLAVLEEVLQQLAREPYNYQASFEALARLLQQQRGSDATTGLS